MIGSGSSRGLGGIASGMGVAVLEKAPDLLKNSARAEIPLSVPRSSDSARDLDALVRMFRCCAYLVHSLMIWFLDSRVSSSQGHVIGSGERGRKAWRNSPV